MTYFFQDTNKNIKIGKAKNLKNVFRRFKACKTFHAHPVVILAVKDGDEEKKLHKEFHTLRIEREWFRPGERLLAYINKLPPYLNHIGRNLASFDFNS